MNGINHVDLVLENCEVITIDGKYIGDFNVENIKSSVSRMGCNYMGKHQSCESFVISIFRDANIQDTPFQQDYFEKQYIFDRLICGDITSVDIFYDDSEHDNLFVPWGGESNYKNTYTTSKKSYLGDLYIVIDPKDTVDDYFKNEEIDNADKNDWIWQMRDIKD